MIPFCFVVAALLASVLLTVSKASALLFTEQLLLNCQEQEQHWRGNAHDEPLERHMKSYVVVQGRRLRPR